MAIDWETQRLEPFTPWMFGERFGDVRREARGPQAFVLLIPADRPPSLVRLRELGPLADAADVGDAGERPPALVVDASKASSDETDLLKMLGRLLKVGGPGLLVRRDGELAGVLAQSTLLDSIAENELQSRGLMALVPLIVYVCQQSRCKAKVYRTSVVTPPPDCPRDHGPMARAKKRKR
jgi:hypothetical protein